MNSIQRAVVEELMSKHLGYGKSELGKLSVEGLENEVESIWCNAPYTFKLALSRGSGWIPSMGGQAYFRNKVVDGNSSVL
jgi:hypothetical protein